MAISVAVLDSLHPERTRGVSEASMPSAGMFIRGIGTATPATRYTKAECLAAFEQSDWFGRLDARSHLIARTVLQRDNGIDARRLAVSTLDEVFRIDPDTLARRFLAHAPVLASQAAAQALQAAGLAAQDIDAVVVSTCTGYLCPGLSGYVAERLGLRPDVQAFDLVGQGCAAALPNMQLGRALLASGACEQVLSVCVEVSSAAMYLDNDAGVLISACLFGDGAGAAVLSRAAPPAGSASRRIEWIDNSSLLDPSQRDALKFESRQGMLRNVLTRAVPVLAAEHALRVLQTVLPRAGLHPGDIMAWILHAGGRDVLQAMERRFELQPADLRYSAAMLREYGNLSSAFVYFVLQAAIADAAPDGWWWLSAFGAGFSCHGALLRVQQG
jgi:alkylresorcinol/alkylpyrone synthase